MRRFIIILIFTHFSVVQFGQIIADHTVVDKYDQIPQEWIDSVKNMFVFMGGMSHALGYHHGLELLELLDPRFQVLTYSTVPMPDPSDQYLRFGRPYMVGIAEFYTSQTAIDRFKDVFLQYGGPDNPFNVVAFGWSYQATWTNPPGGTIDPVYNVHWAGSSEGGLDGNKIWGLDSGDSILTGNRVCMDTYLDAMEQYIQYCKDNNYPTTMLFTNGVVDGNEGTEKAFQRELKNQHIRNYIQGKEGYYFFDYADILVYNDAGEHYTSNWNDNGNIRSHDQIHPDNMMDYDAAFNIIPPETDVEEDHIGEVGALRLGKAMWWMLARIAGWDGNIAGSDTEAPSVPSGLTSGSVTSTSVSISWNASTDNTGVTEYRVYRGGSILGTTTQTNYTDNSVSPCGDYSYSISAMDAAGNESAQSTPLALNNCPSDLTPTLIVTPNISHGVTSFSIIVKITELDLVNTNGNIVVNIPKDAKWDLDGGYDPDLTVLDTRPLNNSNWSYSSDATNHIFTSSVSINGGGFSTFGFRIIFNPDTSRGLYTITSQLVYPGGSESRVSNNSDSEKLDYFSE